MVILFSNEELQNGSVTGKKSNFNKNSTDTKPTKSKLDEKKIEALKSMIYSFFINNKNLFEKC